MDSKQEIAKVAYEIYQRKGITSSEVENWLEAEQKILAQLSASELSQNANMTAQVKKKGEMAKKRKLSGMVV